MSKLISRYRRTTTTRALKQSEPLFTIEPEELTFWLTSGRL